MKAISVLIIVYAVLFLCGCSTNKTTVATPITKDPIAVNMYKEGQKPPLPYKVLGKEIVSKYNFVGMKRQEACIRDAMRNLAAKMGGDAIINITRDGKSVSGTVIAFEQSSQDLDGQAA